MYLKDFNETFQDELRDPEFIAYYLQAALEEDCLPAALRKVIDANGGVIPKQVNDNLEFKTVQSVLNALGLSLAITVKSKVASSS